VEKRKKSGFSKQGITEQVIYHQGTVHTVKQARGESFLGKKASAMG
jgi:hypothetical protein